jgi:hypothetical protein
VLVRWELELSAARRAPQVRAASRELVAAVVSAAGLFLALAVVTFAIEQALTLAVRPWLAAAIVAGGWVCIAGLLLGFDLPWRLKRRLDELDSKETLEAAMAGRADAEAGAREAAARFARSLADEVVRHERDQIAQGAQNLRDTVERDTEAALREILDALLAPGRAGIGLLESLAERRPGRR